MLWISVLRRSLDGGCGGAQSYEFGIASLTLLRRPWNVLGHCLPRFAAGASHEFSSVRCVLGEGEEKNVGESHVARWRDEKQFWEGAELRFDLWHCCLPSLFVPHGTHVLALPPKNPTAPKASPHSQHRIRLAAHRLTCCFQTAFGAGCPLSFQRISLEASAPISTDTHFRYFHQAPHQGVGYRSMCRYFSGPIFEHEAVGLDLRQRI